MGRYFRQVSIWILRIFASITYLLFDLPNRLRFFLSRENVSSKQDLALNSAAHRHILLAAVFQSGNLRLDLQHLFFTARKKGFTVVVVNNSELTERPDVDYYDERSNYGRDFGAYRRAFLLSRHNKLFEDADSVTLLNDSVYFIPDRIETLLSQVQTEVGPSNVFAISDNHDTRYHLASYFVSMGRDVFSHGKMTRFWSKYRLSNSRPTIIRSGEFGFSKAILSITTRDKVVVRHAPELLTKDNDYFRPEFLISNSLISYVRQLTDFPENLVINEPLREAVNAEKIARLLTSAAPAHSLIKVFLQDGMPVIKLDIFFRGVASISDLNQISQDHITDAIFREEFIATVMGKGIGSRDLRGLQRLWHSFGLL